MKVKMKLLTLSTLLLSFFSLVPVYAQSLEVLGINNSQNSLINVVEQKSYIRNAKTDLIEQYGKNYKDKLNKNYKSADTLDKIQSLFKKGDEENIVFSDFIGGLYIDDYDNAVVQIVNNNISKLDITEYSIYKNILSNDSIIIEYVDYSYDDLNKLYKYLIDNYLGKYVNISGIYTDTSLNRIIVELNSYNDDTIKEFKKDVINSEMIEFVKGENFTDITNINPGAKFTSSANRNCSYGYRAKTSSGQIGMVTAGHCFTGNGNTVSGVGTVTKYQNNGTLDAAFIATNSGIAPTNVLNTYPLIYTTNTISTTVVTSYQGLRIAKVGYATGYTFGLVNSSNYSYTSNGVTYTDLIRAGVSADNGDSGGVVVDKDIVFPEKSFRTVGIMKAKGEGSFSGESLITKATKINSTFGLSRY